MLVLLEIGVDRYLEDPVPDLLNAMHSEVDDLENPTLWETYNAGTRALTHHTQDIPDYDLASGFEQVAQLLETGANQLPDPERLGQSAVSNRSRQLIEHGNSEPYWDGERESLRELMEAHELSA